MPPVPVRHVLAFAVTFAALSGCAPAPEPPDHSARFKVLGAVESYDREGWSLAGSDAVISRRTAALPFEGVPALRLRAGTPGFAMIRRTHTKLLVTPFLSWSWFLDYQATVEPPLRVIVGFRGGRREDGAHPLPIADLELPAHDRRLELIWSKSALQRGSLLEPETDSRTPAKSEPVVRRYAVRGGRENAVTWWLETIDLATLYAKAWPRDDQRTTAIAFYGILGRDHAASKGGTKASPGTAYLSGFALSR